MSVQLNNHSGPLQERLTRSKTQSDQDFSVIISSNSSFSVTRKLCTWVKAYFGLFIFANDNYFNLLPINVCSSCYSAFFDLPTLGCVWANLCDVKLASQLIVGI